jgi:hypothetical protein
MADIFVSYASEDKGRIELIANALENLGWSVWWDRFIPVGKPWDVVVEEQLETAKCMLVIWSDNSACSHYVRSEASEGFERNMLVPVFIDEIKIPLAFRQIQAANLIDWRGGTKHSGFQQMIEAIKEHLGEPNKGDKPKEESFSEFFDSMRSKFGETISKMSTPSEQSKKPNKSKHKSSNTARQKQPGMSKGSKIVIFILIGGVLYFVALIFTFFLGMLSPY